MRAFVIRWMSAASVMLVCAASAWSQCWSPGIGSPGLNADGVAVVSWDPDGTGPMPAELAVSGNFTSAGGVSANRVARWNGTTWAALGTGTNGTVLALAAAPNGDLIAAGGFTTAGGMSANRIAKWSGGAWSALGTGMNDLVNCVAVMPNGDIVAGGRFSTAGSTAVNRVARWDGASWSALGAGLGGTPPFYAVSMLVMPGGDLIVGGFFSQAGGSPAECVARWNGSAWSALGVGLEGSVNSLALLPNGDVIAGGQFQVTGDLSLFLNRVGRWNGTSWSPLGTGLAGPVGTTLAWSVCVLPDGDLVAAGSFTSAGGMAASNIARWDGAAWSSIAAGTDASVRGLVVLSDSTLVVAGQFLNAGGSASSRIGRVGCLTCPADFDGDGFVTGDDFDAYVAAFEAGDIASDFNHDGFVTGDDFDALVLAFEAGC